jgi:hypothetical protein
VSGARPHDLHGVLRDQAPGGDQLSSRLHLPVLSQIASARSRPTASREGSVVPASLDLRLVLLFQSVAVKHAQSAMPSVEDVDIAEAASAVAATLETARKGIIYEHQAVSAPAQRLTTELRGVVAELIAQNPSQQARIEGESAVALRRLEQGARTCVSEAAEPDDERRPDRRGSELRPGDTDCSPRRIDHPAVNP